MDVLLFALFIAFLVKMANGDGTGGNVSDTNEPGDGYGAIGTDYDDCCDYDDYGDFGDMDGGW